MENEYVELSETLPVEWPIPNISRRKVDNNIKKRNINKAGGKSEVTVEMLKALRTWSRVDILIVRKYLVYGEIA